MVVGTEPGVQRWSWLLRDLIRQKRRSLRSIERQLGWSNGYLSLVLRDGSPALKVEHVLAILDSISIMPRRFFADLYGLPLTPEDPVSPTREEVERLMDERIQAEQLLREKETAALRDDVERLLSRLETDPPPLDRERLRALVSDSLREELRRLSAPQQAGPKATEQGPTEAGEKGGSSR